MSDYRTVLEPERQSLLPGLGCSVLVHSGLLCSGLLFTVITARCGPNKPVIDLDRTMEVAMISPPKSQTNVPDRAQRAPVPRGTSDAKPDTLPPPVESDLAFKKDDAAEDAGVDAAREQMLAEMERQRLLDDLMAPTGAVDRNATDPNSTHDMDVGATGAGNMGDPELAAYIARVRQLLMANFNPLAAITEGRPDLRCTIRFTVDMNTGRILSWNVAKTSGIDAFDAAAERAVALSGTVPLPPEKFSGLMAEGYTVTFSPQ